MFPQALHAVTHFSRKPKTLVTLKRGNLPDNVEIKRLVKNQLRLLKKLQQRHHVERENMNSAHVRGSYLSVNLRVAIGPSHAKAGGKVCI